MDNTQEDMWLSFLKKSIDMFDDAIKTVHDSHKGLLGVETQEELLRTLPIERQLKIALRASELMSKEVNKLIEENEQLRDENEKLSIDLIYCKTCGSCGEPGCCSPSKCVAVKCEYGEHNLKEYKELLDEIDIKDAMLWLLHRCYGDIDYDSNGNIRVIAYANDIFGYACADSEEIPLSELVALVDKCKTFPKGKEWAAIALWIQDKRNKCPFIPEIEKSVNDILKEFENK